MPQLIIDLPDNLAKRLDTEATLLGLSRADYVVNILEGTVAPEANLGPRFIAEKLAKLRLYLDRVPAITVLSTSDASERFWWFKLHIDIEHRLAWQVVQELGFVLNYISIEERLPTVFMPVSPPSYFNGGPKEYLDWVIEAKIPFLDAEYIADVLEGRLPRPVEDETQWQDEDDSE